MYFDKFDICKAYLAIEMDWNSNGLVDGKSYSSQLRRMDFKVSPLFKGYESLSSNGKEIYLSKIFSLGFISKSEFEERLENETFD